MILDWNLKNKIQILCCNITASYAGHFNSTCTLLEAVGNLVVMASSFKPESPGSIPDAVKDPPSACGVHAHKICGSESPMFGH